MTEKQVKISQNAKKQLGDFLRKRANEESYKPFLPNFLRLTDDKSGYIAYPKPKRHHEVIDPTLYDRGLLKEPENKKMKKLDDIQPTETDDIQKLVKYVRRQGDQQQGQGDQQLKQGDQQQGQGDPQLRQGDPQLIQGDPRLRQGDQQLRRGDPRLGQGDQQLRQGDQQQGQGDQQLRQGNQQQGQGDQQLRQGDQQLGQDQQLKQKEGKIGEQYMDKNKTEEKVLKQMDNMITKEIDDMAVKIQLEAIFQRRRHNLQVKNKNLQKLIREKLSNLQ